MSESGRVLVDRDHLRQDRPCQDDPGHSVFAHNHHLVPSFTILSTFGFLSPLSTPHMPRVAKVKSPPPKVGRSITWRPTKIMNMRDLSKDDDFLSHLLVEKLGTGDVPLLVHKMDATRRLPKTDANVLLGIVKRVRISSCIC